MSQKLESSQDYDGRNKSPIDSYYDQHAQGSQENGYSSGSAANESNSTQSGAGGDSGYSRYGTIPNPVSNYSSTASKPDDERKLFVGGLTWDTTPEDLREYFSSFGGVVDCSIKHDPTTGRSRGFAFLVFDGKEVVEKILAQNDHFVKGRRVDPKPAHRRLAGPTGGGNGGQQQTNSSSSMYSSSGGGGLSSASYGTSAYGAGGGGGYSNNRKVFIGGLDPSFPDSQLREYFSQFGKIDEIDLPYDKEKNERRPFCFISFETEQAAQDVLKLQRHTIGEITVDVKRAKPKTVNTNQQQVYDPYGQQTAAAAAAAYAGYGTGATAYGSGYADPYATWNAYSYGGAQPSSVYGGYAASTTPTASPTAATAYSQYPPSSYPQYAQSSTATGHPASVSSADYYAAAQYGAYAPQSAATASAQQYATDPAQQAQSYDYSQYYAQYAAAQQAAAAAAAAAGNGGGGVTDNGSSSGGVGGNGSSGGPEDYDQDSHYGKAKALHHSPGYHPYSRS